MLIQMLIVILIIGLLVIGPTFENIWLAAAVYGGIIGSLIVGLWYSAKLSGGFADFLLGASGGKIDENLAAGERAESVKDYPAAVSFYQKAIAKNKKSPAPRQKLADLYLRLRNYDLCLRQMNEMLDMCRGMTMDERCALINRMADIYLQRKKDTAAAIEILNRIVEEYPKSTYAGFAHERIAALRE